MAEKTEKATPKKLKDARKKGQVAKSQDLPSAFTFIASLWVILAMSRFLYDYLGGFLVSTFRLMSNPDLGTTIAAVFYDSATVIFLSSIPVLAVVCVIGILMNFLVVGPVVSFEVFKFDIKKFDPVQNLKAKFKFKTLFELLKSLLKVGIACYIIYDVFLASIPTLVKAVSLPMTGALLIFNAFLMEVIIKVGLFFIIVAVADLVYQKRNFANEMKMEKFEVKQEYKNTEGDPQIKGKRRQLAQEVAYQDSPAAVVQKAQAVVTNPTHLAIAIGYNRDIDAAPYILAKAKDMWAERIVNFAEKYNVPVVRNISLAHNLWENGEVYEYVPEDSYEAIAEIMRWLSSLQTDAEYTYSEYSR